MKGLVSKLQSKYKEIGILIDKTLRDLSKDGKISDREKKLEKVMEDIKMRLVLTTGPQKEIGLSQD